MNPRSPRHETILYLLAFLLAFGLRFARLGELPLTDSEARLALDALSISQGGSPALSSHVAYTNLTAVLFFIFGGFNFLARFWPALAGSALVFVPLVFREQVRPRPALILAFFFAIDPAFVALSRQAGGPILTVAASLLAAGFWLRRQPRLAGIFLALALLSGPALWPGLLGLLLAWMLSRFTYTGKQVDTDTGTQVNTYTGKQVDTDTGTQVNTYTGKQVDTDTSTQVNTYTGKQVDTDTSTQVNTYTGKQVDTYTGTHVDTEHATSRSIPVGRNTQLASPNPPPAAPITNYQLLITDHWSLITAFLLTLLAASTLLLLAPQGLGAWLASLPEYITGWAAPVAVPSSRLLLALGVYQLLGILFAVIAILRGWQNGGRRVIRLSLWMLVALLLASFYPARQTADLAWALIPLWTLAALELARHLEFAREFVCETAGVAVFTILLLAFAWMDLNAMYFTPLPSSQGNVRLYLLVGSLFLLVLSVVLVGFGWSARVARVGAAWGAAILLGLYTLGAAWGATGLRIPSAVELWDSSPRIAQADLLSQTADQTSEWATGHADDLAVAVYGVDSPALLWSLRNHHPEVILAFDPASAPALIVTPPLEDIGLAAAYRGQDFTWRQTPAWDLFPSYFLRWLTLRELPTQGETLVLWARSDLFIDSREP